MGFRDKGSDADRSLGKMKIIEGIGFWKKYSGKVMYVMDLNMSKKLYLSKQIVNNILKKLYNIKCFLAYYLVVKNL